MAKLARAHVDGEFELRRERVPGPRDELLASGAEDPASEGHDQARVFGHRDELSGRNGSAPGVLPANERFGSDDAPRRVDLRLIREPELTGSQGAADVVFERPALRNDRLHLRIEQPDWLRPEAFA